MHDASHIPKVGDYRYKLTDETREQLFNDAAEHQMTLEEIGQKYGITRERVRQLFKQRLGITGTNRQSLRTVENKFEFRRGLYPEFVAAVWHEATAHGLTVRGWIDRTLVTRALFINTRRVRILHCEKPWTPNAHYHMSYAHTRITHKTDSHIIVVDNPFEHVRYFYIFPFELCPLPYWINIPLKIAMRQGRRPSVDWDQFKNAWHLLGESHPRPPAALEA